MTQTSYPFDNADTTEAQYSNLFRKLSTHGVWSDPSTSALKPFGDSSGMNVKVPAGEAFVRGHLYVSDAQETLTIAAAATSPRIDLIVLRLNPTANSILLAVKQGTPAANPVAPTLEQTATGNWEIPLAQVSVAANASTISAGNVVDARQYAASPWGRWTTTQRPSLSGERFRGFAGFNFTTGLPEYYDGSTWRNFSPSTITASMISDQQNIDAGKIGGRKITSSTTAPGSPAIGDMWVDFS